MDAETKTPIPNVSVKVAKSKSGTISQNDGVAKIHHSLDGKIHFSHINYTTDSISSKYISDNHIIYLKPLSAREIEEIVIKIPLDDRWIGK